MSAPTVSFNARDFATSVPGLRILAVLPNRFPNRTLIVDQLAGQDKSVMSQANYKDKKINVLAEIGQNTRELLDNAIDTLYALLQPQEAALVVSLGTGTRQWTATLSNVGVSEVMGGHALFDIEFQCSNPFGLDVNTTNLFTTALSGRSGSVNLTFAGTAYRQQPKITDTITNITGGTAKTVTLGNPATGQSVSVNRTWTSTDVLEIDSLNATVKVNGTEVAYTGALPEWAVGAGSLTYTDNLTTGTHTITGLYYKRWV